MLLFNNVGYVLHILLLYYLYVIKNTYKNSYDHTDCIHFFSLELLYTFDQFRIYLYITNTMLSYGMSITNAMLSYGMSITNAYHITKIAKNRIIEANCNKIRVILGWKKSAYEGMLT